MHAKKLFTHAKKSLWRAISRLSAGRIRVAGISLGPLLPSAGLPERWAQTALPSFGVEMSPVGVRNAGEIERALAEFARRSNGGLIVLTITLARALIITLAARHKLPAVYFQRFFVNAGGLVS